MHILQMSDVCILVLSDVRCQMEEAVAIDEDSKMNHKMQMEAKIELKFYQEYLCALAKKTFN